MTALAYELGFWGDCLDTLGEENKHLVYAPLMGIGFDADEACFRSHAATALWSNTVPWAWAASDRIDFVLMYEVA